MTGQNHSFKSPICTWRRVYCSGGKLCLHTGSEYGVRSVRSTSTQYISMMGCGGDRRDADTLSMNNVPWSIAPQRYIANQSIHTELCRTQFGNSGTLLPILVSLPFRIMSAPFAAFV